MKLVRIVKYRVNLSRINFCECYFLTFMEKLMHIVCKEIAPHTCFVCDFSIQS